MARAKRTDRAEARRRYRATLVESDQPIDAETDAEDVEESPARPARARSTAGAAGPPPRPSIVGAFRGAFRPLDLRGDVAALPGLLVHRSFFIPLATIVAAAVVLIVTGGKEPLSLSLSPYFLAPPPLGPVLIAGFMAPRASYLLGGLLGIAAIIATLIALSVTGAALGTGVEPGLLGYSAIVSALGGGFYAASAAWYRRFLAMASPNRNAPRPPRPGDRNRRRDANNRPLLARRR